MKGNQFFCNLPLPRHRRFINLGLLTELKPELNNHFQFDYKLIKKNYKVKYIKFG